MSERVIKSGICPDNECKTKLLFPYYEKSVECTGCGQRHEIGNLLNVQNVPSNHIDLILQTIVNHIAGRNAIDSKTADSVKVLGLSNYHCKLLSPYLSRFGLDKRDGKAKLLTEMGQKDVFDCGVFSDRAFTIDTEHIDIIGYGRDMSGSRNYLNDTLQSIRAFNENEERLIPIHADGDGHCLVHAVSRALVGRELFWHPLRLNLKNHLITNREQYQMYLRDFTDSSEWSDIIDECDPDFIPGPGETLGLRNHHVFGLANVLKRPILLFDSISGMSSTGDYTGTFLPVLVDYDQCRNKRGELNKPLCLAWSSAGRNHYIPLVGIKNKPQPRLHRVLTPKVWALPQNLLDKYIVYDQHNCCLLGGANILQESYIVKLASAIDSVYLEHERLSAALVSDYHHYQLHRKGLVGFKPEFVVQQARRAAVEARLFRCLDCRALCEVVLPARFNFQPGGQFYEGAVNRFGHMIDGFREDLQFDECVMTCSYESKKDELIPDRDHIVLKSCSFCQYRGVRKVRFDGSVVYQDGDRTFTPSTVNHTGFKVFWDGAEYDKNPLMVPIKLSYNAVNVEEKVRWFQNESDHNLNSNVYEIATSLVNKHFPGLFGNEVLIQRAVAQILEATKQPELTSRPEGEPSGGAGVSSKTEAKSSTVHSTNPAAAKVPDKIILTGLNQKVLHKEELGVSQSEKDTLARVKKNAADKQSKENRKKQEMRLQSTVMLETVGAQPMLTSTGTESTGDTPVKPEPQPTNQTIRIVTSQGNTLKCDLDDVIIYDKLSAKIERELGIPVARQRIRYGFPPKVLVAPSSPDDKLPLMPGDKLTVEVVGDQQPAATSSSHTVNDSVISDDDNAEGEMKLILIRPFLEKLAKANASNVDDLIHAYGFICHFAGCNMWKGLSTFPAAFAAPSGALYVKAKIQHTTLVRGQTYSFSLLPNQVFCYNSSRDCLVLHTDNCSNCCSDFMAQRRTQEQIEAFTGQGHSLASGPVDIEMRDSVRPSLPAQQIEPDSTPAKEEDTLSESQSKRKGPGYSVLDPPPTN